MKMYLYYYLSVPEYEQNLKRSDLFGGKKRMMREMKHVFNKIFYMSYKLYPILCTVYYT